MESMRDPIILSSIGLYMVLCIAVGVWAMRRTNDTRDFFMAGRHLGILVAGIAMFSSTMSGFGFVGGPGLVYALGTSSFWILMTVPFGYAISDYTVGKRLRLLAGALDTVSLPDIIALRYNSEAVRGLSALAIILGVLGYLATQMLPRPIYFLLNLRLGGNFHPVTFDKSRFLGLIDNLVGTLVCRIHDARGLYLGFLKALYRLFLGQLEIVTGTICRSQAIGYFFRPLLHGSQYRWPDILHAEHDEADESSHLPKQRKVNIHASLLTVVVDRPQGRPFLTRSGALRSDDENQVHPDTNTNNGDGVDQAGTEEEGYLQFRRQLGLTSRTFDQLTTQQTNTDSGAQGTQPHHDCSGNKD